MQAASEALEFEKAIEYRELLNSVKKVAQKQKITDSSGEDRDVLAVACQEDDAVVQVFFIRGGRLIGRIISICVFQKERQRRRYWTVSSSSIMQVLLLFREN